MLYLAVDNGIYEFRMCSLDEFNAVNFSLYPDLQQGKQTISFPKPERSWSLFERIPNLSNDPLTDTINIIKIQEFHEEMVLLVGTTFGQVLLYYIERPMMHQGPLKFSLYNYNEQLLGEFQHSPTDFDYLSVWSLDISTKHNCLAVGSNSHKIMIIDLLNRTQSIDFFSESFQLLAEGDLVQVINAHSHNIPCLSFSENENLLLSCSVDYSLKIWKLKRLGKTELLNCSLMSKYLLNAEANDFFWNCFWIEEHLLEKLDKNMVKCFVEVLVDELIRLCDISKHHSLAERQCWAFSLFELIELLSDSIFIPNSVLNLFVDRDFIGSAPVNVLYDPTESLSICKKIKNVKSSFSGNAMVAVLKSALSPEFLSCLQVRHSEGIFGVLKQILSVIKLKLHENKDELLCSFAYCPQDLDEDSRSNNHLFFTSNNNFHWLTSTNSEDNAGRDNTRAVLHQSVELRNLQFFDLINFEDGTYYELLFGQQLPQVSDRFSISIFIPELSLFAVGSQSGYVVLVKVILTSTETRRHRCFVQGVLNPYSPGLLVGLFYRPEISVKTIFLYLVFSDAKMLAYKLL